mgnify:CR=1 FL=1
MRVEAILSTLTALDGCEEDLDKVLILEDIAQSYRKKDGKAGDDEDDE